MPNRILKESIRTSRDINDLTDFQFRVWAYLITYVDDYGRGSADPMLLKGMVFPRRKGVTESQIAKVLIELATRGMINLYEDDGESYFYFSNWDKHQRIRNQKSKFPDPVNCQQVAVNCQQDAADCGLNPIQSNPNTIQNQNTNKSTEQTDVGSMPSTGLLFSLPLNDGTEFDIQDEWFKEWEKLYPAVNIMTELRKMRGWLESNPKRRKTKTGILRFVTSWLSRTQDNSKGTGGTLRPNTRFHNMEERDDDIDQEALAMTMSLIGRRTGNGVEEDRQ